MIGFTPSDVGGIQARSSVGAEFGDANIHADIAGRRHFVERGIQSPRAGGVACVKHNPAPVKVSLGIVCRRIAPVVREGTAKGGKDQSGVNHQRFTLGIIAHFESNAAILQNELAAYGFTSL